MKKILCLTSLIFLQQQALATCIPSSDSNGNNPSVFVWTMNIKNSTTHTLSMSGDCTSPSTIAPGATKTYTGTVCYTNGGSISSTSCQATDEETRQSVTFSANYVSCTNISPDAQANQTPTSLYPFYCNGSYTPGSIQTSSSCGTNLWTNSQTMFYDVYYFPNYALTWNNIVANLAKGQTMANKLAHSLQNALSYQESTATYSRERQQLNITLSKGSADNPYDSKDPTACYSMQPVA